jgi:hypothetical protein
MYPLRVFGMVVRVFRAFVCVVVSVALCGSVSCVAWFLCVCVRARVCMCVLCICLCVFRAVWLCVRCVICMCVCVCVSLCVSLSVCLESLSLYFSLSSPRQFVALSLLFFLFSLSLFRSLCCVCCVGVRVCCFYGIYVCV